MCAGGGEPVCELLWCAHNSLSVCIVVLVFIIPEPLDALARITVAKALVDTPQGTPDSTQSGAVLPRCRRLCIRSYLSCTILCPFCDVLSAGSAVFGGRVGG